jgi:hypothetical protein
MLSRSLSICSLAALAGAAMLALSMSSASAFSLSSPSLEQPLASSQIDKVWWDRWGRWHPGYGYGYGHGYGYRHCWRGYNGYLRCN